MGQSTDTALAALKISGRVAYERLARPMARRFDDVPCTPYAVTPEWLTAVLCGKVPGAIVTDVEIKPASAGTHERHQLRVSYNEEGRRAGLPVSIFTKSLPSIVTRMIGGFNGTARVEGSFFTQIRAQLEIEAPLCYHSAYDRRTFAAIHLLEDLVATKSATFCNHKTYVTRAMADDMIDLLASLHGRFYGDPTLAERYRWLASYPRWFTIGAAKMGTEYYTRKAFDAAAHVIPAAVMARRDDVWPATMRALALHDSEPQGLIHSDVHIGNWYRTGSGQMGLCDWQCLSRGHWSRDFAYAVTASLTPDDRRSWERELLARYIERFAEKTGVKPDFDLSFRRYRQQIVHALAMWTITLCHSPLLPNMQPEATTLTMIGRMTTAMADLDALDS
ncbi:MULTISPECIES: phosphotransferase family protein [unclassified Bradyrhizobium]|uniref:phosphotransferase family protein n=1 Tax=unclassified Bradyrhizobium TaxID=2631580 RepID=UPI001BA8C73A|nr:MULTISPECIES: aminoglycoside phosphotransferase family protein [unclassified Bradyrhizobium]MBR1224537.1 aminoglycoside phosphotransferase family protein [Bradyrhizobium sp. AUGA SZCCT0176]MBR1231160.1 aminoglycoside phosphotransferase family protein [Bradyrhizobium sp. AUGA SZCCT0182]MBR1286010.1 aminoglycoside phosphotransferase family protein [Bradyrhizobium sp. AUGA SZCCT0177]MBR1295837.1 aminoglycoside phosphotransferase family protein [Bradyrhizobium sp. AUGA SZCCT0042]